MDLISTVITDQSPREDSGLEREDKNGESCGSAGLKIDILNGISAKLVEVDD